MKKEIALQMEELETMDAPINWVIVSAVVAGVATATYYAGSIIILT